MDALPSTLKQFLLITGESPGSFIIISLPFFDAFKVIAVYRMPVGLAELATGFGNSRCSPFGEGIVNLCTEG